MPFEIVRNDIVNMRVDAIVNTANPNPVIGSGTDAGIHAKAGPGLLAERQKIGRISVGHAAITPAFELDARYVIHTVGPLWQGGQHQERELLLQCYTSSLKLAWDNGCTSIAFPLISTGNYGFPKDQALQIAIQAFSTFLMDHEMQIYLVVFNRNAFELSEKLFRGVSSYIDENYVAAKEKAQYAPQDRRWGFPTFRRMDSAPYDAHETMVLPEASVSCPMPAAAPSLDEMLANTDAGFTETLLKLIDKTGKKDSQIYKKANITKQHFSKIRNNPNYKPTKSTAVAFAIALELDLDETKDLIGRAGYALNNNSKFDVIITYFIREKHYDLFDINAALFKFDQSLLGM